MLDEGFNKTSQVSYNDAFVITISEVVGEIPEDDLLIDEDGVDPVSYTHLTLPTILLV